MFSANSMYHMLQEGIAALIIGTALGTSLFLIGEKSPESERALQNP
jgi:hypothetical protein